MDFKKITQPIENIFDRLWNFAGKSTSVLVAFAFMVFTFGSLFGYFIAMHASLRQEVMFLLVIPPILGLLAYYYRTFAIICFIVFLLFILI